MRRPVSFDELGPDELADVATPECRARFAATIRGHGQAVAMSRDRWRAELRKFCTAA